MRHFHVWSHRYHFNIQGMRIITSHFLSMCTVHSSIYKWIDRSVYINWSIYLLYINQSITQWINQSTYIDRSIDQPTNQPIHKLYINQRWIRIPSIWELPPTFSFSLSLPLILHTHTHIHTQTWVPLISIPNVELSSFNKIYVSFMYACMYVCMRKQETKREREKRH